MKIQTSGKNQDKILMLVVAAVCMALSYVLSYIRLFSLPQGGSVSAFSMVPLMLFAWLYGVREGILTGVAYGLLQLIQKPEIVHVCQLLLDYPLAFGVMGLAGLFRCFGQKKWAFPAGIAVACFARFVCHFLSGAIFFAEYAPASGFWPVVIYSAGYNGGYMGVEMLISMALVMIPPVANAFKAIKKILRLA